MERAILGGVFGPEFGIEHVGSTAVPGLIAKPVVDVAIAYANRDALATIRAALATAGYEDRGDQGDAGGRMFVKGPPSCRTHHLHLVSANSRQWRGYLAFRDALRADQTLRRRYAALKIELAGRFAEDRAAYTDGKDAFVRGVLGRRGPDGEKSRTIHPSGADTSRGER